MHRPNQQLSRAESKSEGKAVEQLSQLSQLWNLSRKEGTEKEREIERRKEWTCEGVRKEGRKGVLCPSKCL
jgi:hypothetical protein